MVNSILLYINNIYKIMSNSIEIKNEINNLFGNIKTQEGIKYYEINNNSGVFYRKDTEIADKISFDKFNSPKKGSKTMVKYPTAWFSPNQLGEAYKGHEYTCRIKSDKSIKLIALDQNQTEIFKKLKNKKISDYLQNDEVLNMIPPHFKNLLIEEDQTQSIIEIFIKTFPYDRKGNFDSNKYYRNSVGMWDRLLNAILYIEFKNFNGYAAKQLPQENTEDLLHAEFTIHNYDDVIELVNIDIRPPSIKKRTPRRKSPPSKKKRKSSLSSKKTSSKSPKSKSPKSKSPIFNPFSAFNNDSLSPPDSLQGKLSFGGNKGKINKRYTRKNKN
jgi:hypothetical protein